MTDFGLGPFFVTSSGTEIGKTLVTAALIHQLRAAGRKVAALKPVLTGYRAREAPGSDAGILAAALGQPCTPDVIAAISPFRYEAPLSPDMASLREGRPLDSASVIAQSREAAAGAASRGEILLIEGIGGVMVPLDGAMTVRDWISALGCPALLVVGSYLGAMSHTLTAALALRVAGVPLAAVIVSETEGSEVPLDETVASLTPHLAPAPVIALPRIGAGPAPWTRAAPLIGRIPDLAPH